MIALFQLRLKIISLPSLNSKKNKRGTEALNKNNLICKALKIIKRKLNLFPNSSINLSKPGAARAHSDQVIDPNSIIVVFSFQYVDNCSIFFVSKL